MPGPERDDGEGLHAHADRWHLLGLTPLTLVPESTHPFREPLLGFSVAPDGEQAYALAGRDSSVGSRTVVQIDLRTGAPAAPRPCPRCREPAAGSP